MSRLCETVKKKGKAKSGINFLIACGGSGGHIFPGVALAEAITELNKNCKVFIVTSDRHIDMHIFREKKFPYYVLPYNPLPDSPSPLRIFKFLLNLLKAVFKSFSILKVTEPYCVIGLGGYVSGPIIFVAWLMRKHILVHEQNIIPSLTNRLSSVFADKVCITFDDTKNYFRKKFVVKTGNPIRYNFLKRNAKSSHQVLELDPNRFTILVLGGSQGSSFLNNSVKEAISQMENGQRMKLQILHLTGKKDFYPIKEEYEKIGIRARVYAFLEEMGYAYETANLIISRAGATALSEISAFGKPSILVPYPKRRVHQKENAEFFSNGGASICIEEKNLSTSSLKDTILTLVNDPNKLCQMAHRSKTLGNPDAAHNLAIETLDLVKR